MMKLLCAILLSLGLVFSSASATPRYTATKQAVEKLRKDERLLARQFKKLSKAERKKLKAALSRGTDSDGDGLTDILEGAVGTNRCDADSDDDGSDDSDDGAENDPSSDGGEDDSNNPSEVEVKGSITSFDGTILLVKGESFTVSSSTIYRGEGFGKDELDPGVCVEVKGRRSGDVLSAVRIKRESQSECQ
jgi:hypothetical protein